MEKDDVKGVLVPKNKNFIVYDGKKWKRNKLGYMVHGWKLHQYVWMKYNGRIPIAPEENQLMGIHHIDRDKDNNLLDNLQLMTTAEHNNLHGNLRRGKKK